MVRAEASFDVAIVGGGIGGATLALVLAKAGVHVLVCEQETAFRDRVRGEALLPWGVSEAQTLEIEQILVRAGARRTRYWNTYVPGLAPRRRDLEATTPSHNGTLHFSHPAVQTALLDSAREHGAKVWQGAVVREVVEGQPPCLHVHYRDAARSVRARLVVVATGRSRRLQSQLGHHLREDPKRLEMAGVLLTNARLPLEAAHVVHDMQGGAAVLLFPQDEARVRAYLAYDKRAGAKNLSGPERVSSFLEECGRIGVPPEWLADAYAVGPLASFEAHSTWIDHPYRHDIAFIGDAAGTSDPCFGEGLSLTLRDVRVLRDSLLTDNNWDDAAHGYAVEHDKYFAALRCFEDWLTQVFFAVGSHADALRERVLPRMAKGAGPDIIGRGPDSPCDQAAYDALFGE